MFLWNLTSFGVFIGLRTVVIVVAAYFMNAFHKDLFDAHVEDLAITGIFERVRHPMYLEASIRVWLIIFAFNNTRANYEEKKLEERFGDEFLKYKRVLKKWISIFPRPTVCILWLTLISAHSIIAS
jgi:protein-S-isoprenylcysteine O-methyltransferase Ste14